MLANEQKEIMAYRQYAGKRYTEEAKLLKDAIEFLTYLPKTKVVRIDNPSTSGISDILVCYNGYFVAIELKDDIGKASAQQRKFILEVQQANGISAVCRSIDDIWKLLLQCRRF